MASDQSGNMTGLGAVHLYRQLAEDLVSACVKTAAAVGRRVSARIENQLRADEWERQLEAALVAHNYAPGTVRKYSVCVARFLRAHRWTSADTLTGDDVRRHMSRLRSEGLGNGSLRLHLCAIRAVFDKILEKNITAGIVHAPRPPRRPVATEEQVTRLMAACRNDQERQIIHSLNSRGLLPGRLRSLVRGAGDREALAEHTHGRCSRTEARAEPSVAPAGSRDGGARHRWLLPSPVRQGPISLRTLQRRVERIGSICGTVLTCTAIRLAPTVSDEHAA